MKHNTFDLNLSDWGPYGKEYIGLSHIANARTGDRWDCFVMAGLHRRAAIGPYGLRENRWHFWKTAADFSSYTLRYEIEWKDQVYVDASFSGKGDGRFIEATCVNHSELPQNLDVHLAARLTRNPLAPATVECPPEGVWVSALDYDSIQLAGQPHRERHVADALKPGQWIQPGTVRGESLGAGNFFNRVGDRVEYAVDLPGVMTDAVLLLRYHRWLDAPCRMKLSSSAGEQLLDLVCDGTPMRQESIPLGNLEQGPQPIALELAAGGGLVLEGFAVVPRGQADQLRVAPAPADDRPEMVGEAGDFRLNYAGLSQTYQITCQEDYPLRLRRITGEDVPAIQNMRANDGVLDHWTGTGGQEAVLLTCGPIPLQPGESKTLRFQVGLAGAVIEPVEDPGPHYDPKQPYAFGMERLAATTLANVVYPIRHRSGYVRHNTPGRWWDCLYTWDSGMLGLGLAALDTDRAKECLNQYLLPENDPYAAFIEHGTPLPIQAELAREIWDRTQDLDWLAATYPKLRNFYEWLAGRSHGSTTDRFQTGLLQTWDYNYNSGGWDDYPPQHALANEPERRQQIAPAVTTSFAIRFAKHMQHFFQPLENGGENPVYTEDIARWSAALESAWDEESGYYAYVEHDQDGAPTGFYRHESGENYNRGLDGIAPLITGVLPDARRDRLLQKLFDPSELWTPWGATTVSQSAAFYSDAGYWNGAVWMPHNYMLWKSLREQGYTMEARKLAKALLGCWERECRASYHCFELFRANTGRGSGWHQFGGLSAPLLAVCRAEFPA